MGIHTVPCTIAHFSTYRIDNLKFLKAKTLRIKKTSNFGHLQEFFFFNTKCQGSAINVSPRPEPTHKLVWFHPDKIFNILSLSKAKAQYHITYDREKGNTFVVHKPNVSSKSFIESEHSLYYLDMHQTFAPGNVLIDTVAKNKENISKPMCIQPKK